MTYLCFPSIFIIHMGWIVNCSHLSSIQDSSLYHLVEVLSGVCTINVFFPFCYFSNKDAILRIEVKFWFSEGRNWFLIPESCTASLSCGKISDVEGLLHYMEGRSDIFWNFQITIAMEYQPNARYACLNLWCSQPFMLWKYTAVH